MKLRSLEELTKRRKYLAELQATLAREDCPLSIHESLWDEGITADSVATELADIDVEFAERTGQAIDP